jgi:hypothetical protein
MIDRRYSLIDIRSSISQEPAVINEREIRASIETAETRIIRKILFALVSALCQ